MPKNLDSGSRKKKWRLDQVETMTTCSLGNGSLWRAACILGVMAGCGVTRWEHLMKGIGVLQQDMAACEARAKQSGQEGDPHTGNMLSLQDHIDECLQARGYVKRSGR